jgi:hypothetical protein
LAGFSSDDRFLSCDADCGFSPTHRNPSSDPVSVALVFTFVEFGRPESPMMPSGERVRIIAGPLAGLTGIVQAPAGEQRYVVVVDFAKARGSAELDERLLQSEAAPALRNCRRSREVH